MESWTQRPVRFAVDAHDAFRFGEGQTAQEEIVHQTEDRGVHSNPQSERDYGEKRKSGRFAELSQSEAQVVHRMFDVRCLMFDFIRHEVRSLDRPGRPVSPVSNTPRRQQLPAPNPRQATPENLAPAFRTIDFARAE